MKATNQRASPHARIFASWLELPTWKALSPCARVLLIEMMGRYRPGDNGRLAWPVRRAAEVIGSSKSSAANYLVELERNGWIEVVKVSAFGGRATPATYRLSMFQCDETGALASRAYQYVEAERSQRNSSRKLPLQSSRKDKAVPLAGRDGALGGTEQYSQRDDMPSDGAPLTLSDALRKSKFLSDISKKGHL